MRRFPTWWRTTLPAFLLGLSTGFPVWYVFALFTLSLVPLVVEYHQYRNAKRITDNR